MIEKKTGDTAKIAEQCGSLDAEFRQIEFLSLNNRNTREVIA